MFEGNCITSRAIYIYHQVGEDDKPGLAVNALAGMFASGILTADNIPSCANAKVPTVHPSANDSVFRKFQCAN